MDFSKYQIPCSTRQRENIEWSVSYCYNAPDKLSSRVLLIGDSIVKASQQWVREQLPTDANISFWATSKCVSDPDYLRELDFITDSGPFSLIFFNNGIHARTSDPAEWKSAYANTVRFLQDKLPGIPLILMLSTPSRSEKITDTIFTMNQWVVEFSKQNDLPVLDWFSPVAVLEKTAWVDDFHFRPDVFEMLASLISGEVRKRISGGGLEQKSTLTGPDGILK